MRVEVLIVDDEPQAVKYFQKLFESKYKVLTATSADEAERIIFSSVNDIGIVITDQRMPGRNGISLLESVSRRRPDIIRILTTAYSDLDTAIKAVNDGQIWRYITKPWDLQALEADIDQAATFFLLHREYELLLNEKLGAFRRTVLRERINTLASIASALGQYKNAKTTLYRYIKDSLDETSLRPAVYRQWQLTRPEDHWRLAVNEAQRFSGVAETLSNLDLVQIDDDAPRESNVISVLSECADALTSAHSLMSVQVRSEADTLLVAAHETKLKAIVDRLLRPMANWAARGTPVVIEVKNVSRSGEAEGALIKFEIRNFEPEKAIPDCILHTPPLHATTDQSIEFLRAALAIGHMGGKLSITPAQNGFKQIFLTLPTKALDAPANANLPSDWIADLNDDYERWVFGALDMAV